MFNYNIEYDIILRYNIIVPLRRILFVKKYFYYITPFILVPTLMLLCEHLQNTNVLSNLFLYSVIILALLSAIMGNLSPTNKKFDYLMAVIMPLSLFCLMFIGGFLDKSDLGSRFQLDRGIKTALQVPALILYGIMGLITFLSSYKGIRVVKLLKPKQ